MGHAVTGQVEAPTNSTGIRAAVAITTGSAGMTREAVTKEKVQMMGILKEDIIQEGVMKNHRDMEVEATGQEEVMMIIEAMVAEVAEATGHGEINRAGAINVKAIRPEGKVMAMAIRMRIGDRAVREEILTND